MNETRTPIGDASLPLFPRFIRLMIERLDTGRKEYGDRSFLRPASDVLGEIEQELLDIVGWGFIEWVKLQEMRAKLAQVEQVVS